MTTDDHPRNSFAANVTWGIAWGLALAVLFSLLASIIAVVGVLGNGDSFSGLRQVIASYVLAGAAAGFLVGILKPFTQSLIGSMLVGAIAGVTMYGSVAYSADRTIKLDFALTAGIPVGVVVGAWLWWQRRREKKS
jgi:hypothetical protein